MSPSCLVLTLYCGERDFEPCLRSIQSQIGVDIVHKVIRFLPNREAHEALYAEIMDNSKRHDSFVKLDADMVLKDNLSLGRLISPVISGVTDHAIFPVHDYYAGDNIYGVSAFSGTATWPFPLPAVFVDPDPSVSKPSVRADLGHRADVLHCHHASLRQSFQFGLHRGLKAVAARDISIAGSHNALLTLVRVARTFHRKGGLKRLLALEGALWGRSTDPQIDYKSAPVIDELFEKSRERLRKGIADAAIYWSTWGETELVRRRLVRKFHHLTGSLRPLPPDNTVHPRATVLTNDHTEQALQSGLQTVVDGSSSSSA